MGNARGRAARRRRQTRAVEPPQAAIRSWSHPVGVADVLAASQPASAMPATGMPTRNLTELRRTCHPSALPPYLRSSSLRRRNNRIRDIGCQAE